MLGRLSPVLVLAILAAGCVQPSLTPAATNGAPAVDLNAPRPDVVAPKFGAPFELGTVMGGAEPNVAVDGKYVYVSSPLHLWRSEDGGKSFKQIGKDICPRGLPACGPLGTKDPGLTGGGDGAIAVNATGALFWAGLGGGVPVQVSLDHGDTWSKAVDVANKNSSDREWVAVDPSGVLHVSWRDFGGSGASPNDAFVVTRSSTDGIAFTPTVRITKDGHQGPIAPDPSSAWLYVPHVDGSTKLVIARSNDGGATWEDLPVAPLVDDTFQFPIAAVDQAGTVYIAYANGNFDKTDNYLADRLPNIPTIMLTHSKDHGATWSKPVAVSTPGAPAVFPWIAAGAPGRVAIAYYQGEFPAPMVAPNAWRVAMTLSTTADSDAPKLARGTVTANPTHVGQVCVVGSGCGPQDRSLLDFFEVRLLADGAPVLAYTADADIKMETVKVLFATMTDGTKLVG